MKICPQCDGAVTTKSTFCSIKCSNQSRRKDGWKDRQRRDEWIISIREQAYKNMMSSNFEDLCYDLKRKRVIIEQQNACNKCGISEWFHTPIILEIDHKDGDSKHNNRTNLEGLCPNCHSLTPTWRGRNKACVKVDDGELIASLKEHSTIRQALLAVGMVGKGGNYRRAKNLIKKHNINMGDLQFKDANSNQKP